MEDNSFKLVQLSQDDGVDVYEMLQRIGASENAFNNDAYGLKFSQFKEWLLLKDSWSRGERLPLGYVKQWIYWLEVDGKPVGFGKLRESLTSESLKFGGNIGFAIDPLVRRRGYGTIIIKMLLDMAREKEIFDIWSTVEKDNIYSRKIHEGAGGILIKEDKNRFYYEFNLNNTDTNVLNEFKTGDNTL